MAKRIIRASDTIHVQDRNLHVVESLVIPVKDQVTPNDEPGALSVTPRDTLIFEGQTDIHEIFPRPTLNQVTESGNRTLYPIFVGGNDGGEQLEGLKLSANRTDEVISPNSAMEHYHGVDLLTPRQGVYFRQGMTEITYKGASFSLLEVTPGDNIATFNSVVRGEPAVASNDFVTKAQLDSGVGSANLQSVTTGTGNNVTNRGIQVTGVAGIDLGIDSIAIYKVGDDLTLAATKGGTTFGSLVFDITTGVAKLSGKAMAFGLNMLDPSDTASLQVALFDGTVAGAPGVLSNQFTTVSQVIRNQDTTDQAGSFRIDGEGIWNDTAGNSTNIFAANVINTGNGVQSLLFSYSLSFEDTTNNKSSQLTADYIRFVSAGKTINVKGDWASIPGTPIIDLLWPSTNGKIALVTEITSAIATGQTIGANTTGNAATVTNGVYTTGSYADPSWITSLAYSKLTGTPSLAAYELLANKQNSLTVDGGGVKYPTVDAVNTGLSGKQATLVSGTNIKTVNGNSLLGSGDITIDLSTLVPYTGATTNVNLGTNTITSSGGFIGNASTATTAGTVTTAAQPSITSVGTLTGLTVTAPIVGSVTGNAGTVTNGVYTNGTYPDPAWITSLAYAKLTGVPTFALDANVIHTSTANETKTGRLTLATPAAAAGAAGVAPLIVTGGKAGANTATTGTVTSGTAANINITGGAGGDITGIVSGTALSGSGGKINITGGDGGNTLGTPTSSFPGSGGDVVFQAGGSYGGNAGSSQQKAGNNYKVGGIGGDVFIVPGWGNNSSASNAATDGTMWMGYSPGGTTRGNVVINATVDDRINKLQVTGDSLFTGKAYVTVAPTDPTGVVRKLELDTALAAGLGVNTVSAAGTLTLTARGYYTFNGTTTTWTLPSLAGASGTLYRIINMGSGNLTLSAGTNEIYDSGTSSTTYVVGSTISLSLYNNGIKWVILG